MTITINGTTGISGVDGSAATPAFKGSDSNTGISFGTDTVTINTGGVARVTTDASGNVGIGTSSPNTAFHVVSSNTQAKFEGSVQGNVIIQKVGTNGMSLYSNSAGTLAFYDNNSGTERMRLDSSGNLGLGVTPSAWTATRKAIQIGAGGALVGRTDTAASVNVSANIYFDGTNNTYIGSNFATIYAQSNGAHQWFTAPSGTAGNAISFTQAMTLDADGDLGIGVTSPAFKLDVSHSANTVARFQTTSVGSYGAVQINNTNTNGEASIGFRDSSDSDATSWVIGKSVNVADAFGWYYGSARMTLDASGNLLVGTTNNASSARVFLEQTTANPVITTFTNRVSSQGNPGISIVKKDNDNTTSQTYATFIYNNFASGAGGIQGNGASGVQFFSSSDARLKENVQELEPQLPNIMALKPSKFDYINGPKGCTGFIAQEMEQVYPDAVGETLDGYKTIGGISIMEARLVSAIQEQQAIITKLQADVAALKGAA